MATTKKSMAATPAGRKKVFRATAGLTIDQQLQMASQLQAQGDDVLKTIRQMKKTSKNQKQTTKTNNLKFEWLQEHSRLKKLEENCSKELESLLLRMYNEASTARESRKCRTQDTPSKDNVTTPRSACDSQQNDEDSEDDNDNNSTHASTTLMSTSTIYAAELEDLIRTEQLNRVALINQITSEREQRAALNQLLSALQSTDSHPEKNNQISSEDMQANVHQLIYDAVIGRQMIESTLEEEVHSCEKDFDASYRKVLETLRNGTNTAGTNVENLHDQDEKITAMLEAVGGNECHDEMLRLEISDEYLKVFAELRDDLAQYEQEFINAASANDVAGSIEAATCKRGGWSEPDEERFLKILRSYDKKHGAGKKPQLLYDQLALVLPNVPLLEIKKHVKFHQHHRFHQEKRKDRQREFQRKLEELQNNVAARFRMAVEQEQDRVRRMQQLSEMQQQCEQRHNQVSQWRVTKEAKERIEQQQREIDQLLGIQKQQDEEVRWKRKHDQQKAAVEEYKKCKAVEKMANENLTIEEEQRREKERAVQSIINAERVQYRHLEFQRKKEEMMQEELHKAHLEEKRLEKLNELKETTPYAQIIANIAPDPERTRQETAAFRANAEAANEGLPITETGLFPSHGYDCETLFKNARFKLGIALRNAGLGSSEYARQALANVKVCNVGAYRNHVSEPTKLW